jgi:hypothetical protein
LFFSRTKIGYSELLRFTEGNAERAQPIFISSPLHPLSNLQPDLKLKLKKTKDFFFFKGYRVHELFETVNTPCSPDEFACFIKKRGEYI